jgi:hypothetical protein
LAGSIGTGLKTGSVSFFDGLNNNGPFVSDTDSQ